MTTKYQTRNRINKEIKAGNKIMIRYNKQYFHIDKARILQGRLQVREVPIASGRKIWRTYILSQYQYEISKA